MSDSISSSYVILPSQTAPESKSVAQTTVNHPSLKSTAYEPGSSATFAHDWSKSHLAVHGRHFIDQYGRVCQLRGVNLSGCSKTPVNDDHSTFPAHAEAASFVGRPFPLEEAHEHLSRLRRWGFTFIRFLVTWEAVEHAGPGQYDMDYLNYIKELLSMLPRYGMVAFVALHQDVWSRYTGGSGAPAWTVEAVGFDLHSLEESHAAWLLGVKGGGHIEAERGIWPCGYQKLAASTMSTCFWAGDTFAPNLQVTDARGEKVSIQSFLQNAFLDMFDVLAQTVGHLESVMGFEIMNEPHRGYIDIKSLYEFDYNTDLHLSFVPSAIESFQLGAGYPTQVVEWVRSFPMPTRKGPTYLLNQDGHRAWRADGPTNGRCLWQLHGVWDYDLAKKKGVVLRENYFKCDPTTGRKVDWYTDFYYPFFNKWAKRVRAASSPDKLVFVEPIPNEFCPRSWTPEHQPQNMVFAPHWYDLNALFQKAFGDFSINVQGISRGMFPLYAFYWGHRGARENFSLQIRNITQEAYHSLGEKPVIFGECGIPMDMNGREAFTSGDFSWQARMMDAMITAFDRALVGFTLWNYNPRNSDTHGDDWNGENFSWFSHSRSLASSILSYEQDSAELDHGGRILPSIVRPYPVKTSGIPLNFHYEVTSGAFSYEWANPAVNPERGASKDVHSPPLHGHPSVTSRETELFVPSSLTSGRRLIVQGLSPDDTFVLDESRQTLFVVTPNTVPGHTHKLLVSFDPPVEPPFRLDNVLSAYGLKLLALALLLLSILYVSFQ